MNNYNYVTTYKYIAENIDSVFFDILDFKNKALLFKNNNLMPVREYEDILEKRLSKLEGTERFKTGETLSVKNLIEKGMFSPTDELPGCSYKLISITQHLLEMTKNCFKQYESPLTASEYQEFETLMKSHAEYFKMYHSDMDEVEERFNTFFIMIENVQEKIVKSISVLNYEKDTISEKIFDQNNDKYKYAKKIQEKHITPLYIFTSDKKSVFLKELIELHDYFLENDSFYNQMRKINFYISQIVLHIKDVVPIRQYISGVIQQEELELKRSRGIERIFNELTDFIHERSVGDRNKKYLWALGTKDEIDSFNPIFKAMGRSDKKDENIKLNTMSKTTLDFYYDYLLEEFQDIKVKQKIELRQNEDYAKKMLEKKERKKELLFLDSILKDLSIELNLKLKENNSLNLFDFLVEFFSKSYKDWKIGYISHFWFYIEKNIKYRLSKNNNADMYTCIDLDIIDNIRLVRTNNKKVFIRDGKKIKYFDTNIIKDV